MDILYGEVKLPDFGLPTEEPKPGSEIYAQRIDKVRRLMMKNQVDVLLVYGDREHQANVTYLCGYDPRFEETILIISPQGTPTLLVGNEGWGYAELATLPIQRVLYQTLSLLGQDRSKSPQLASILHDTGVRPGSRVGIAGWKYFSADEFSDFPHSFEVPSYLVDTVRSIAGHDHVVNVTGWFMNPVDGLRIINEADQLAAFEFAACYTSTALKNVLFGVRPGMTELEAATLMKANGLPLAAHTMLSGGRRAAYGLPSPSTRPLQVGDRFTMAYSIWGALNARAGWFVHDAHELPPSIGDYIDKLAKPYFKAAVSWYETIGIGVTGGMLYDAVHNVIGDPFYGVSLNPGHYIHFDEWVHSPVFKDSTIEIKSGMALQVDIIPATGSDYHTSNIEDGIAIADETMRNDICDRFPSMWKRIEARRAFMKDTLGIRLKPEVLPFSNIPAYLPPFVLSPGKALRVSKTQ